MNPIKRKPGITQRMLIVSRRRKEQRCSFGLRRLHLQRLGASLPTKSLLPISTHLKAFLRLVKAPSHAVFLLSNAAILIQLHYFSTHVARASEREASFRARFQEQETQMELLKQEEDLIKAELAKCPSIKNSSEDIQTDESAFPLARTRSSSSLCSSHQDTQAGRFLDQRRLVCEIVGKANDFDSFFHNKGPNWSKLASIDGDSSSLSPTRLYPSRERSHAVALANSLVLTALSKDHPVIRDAFSNPTKSQSSETVGSHATDEADASHWKTNSSHVFRSMTHELSRACLTYNSSDTTNFVRSSLYAAPTRSSGHVGHPDVSSLRQNLEMIFKEYSNELNCCNLIFALARCLIQLRTARELLLALSFVFEKLGQENLKNYQALVRHIMIQGGKNEGFHSKLGCRTTHNYSDITSNSQHLLQSQVLPYLAMIPTDVFETSGISQVLKRMAYFNSEHKLVANSQLDTSVGLAVYESFLRRAFECHRFDLFLRLILKMLFNSKECDGMIQVVLHDLQKDSVFIISRKCILDTMHLVLSNETRLMLKQSIDKDKNIREAFYWYHKSDGDHGWMLQNLIASGNNKGSQKEHLKSTIQLLQNQSFKLNENVDMKGPHWVL